MHKVVHLINKQNSEADSINPVVLETLLSRHIETPARELNVPATPTIKDETLEMLDVSEELPLFLWSLRLFRSLWLRL